jgi:hypothetical protein
MEDVDKAKKLKILYNLEIKNASPRGSFELLTMIWKERRGRGFCTTALGCFLELLVAKIRQHLPLD